MLKKKERLTRKEFDRAFSMGKRIHSPSIQLIYTPSEASHGSVVVGKKVAKKAVDRNKLRRRVYAVLYQYLKGNKPHTVILIAKAGALAIPRQTLAEEVRSLLLKIP